MMMVSAGVLASKLLGLARDILLALVWGTGAAMDAFVFAFTIPNLLRGLFGEGAFTSAFVPVFSEKLEKEGKPAAWRAACRVVSVLALVLGGLVLAGMLLCFAVLPFIHRPDLREGLLMTPFLLPYGLLLCLAVALAGVLNTFHRFTVPALTPLLLNVFMIAAAGGAWWLVPHENLRNAIWLLAPAILAAGVVHFWIHLLALKRQEGLLFRFDPAPSAPEVGQVGRLMAPALVGTGMIQINVMVDRLLAMILGGGAVSALYYSQRIIYVPVGLFGVAAGVVALPALSRSWARGERGEFLGQLSHSLRNVFFLCLPLTVLMLVTADPMVRLFFQRGNFTDKSVTDTLLALAFYLPGIPFFSLVKPLAAGFYARHDTRTPVRIAWCCLALNIALNLSLMWWLRQGGLALSTSLCSFANFSLLLWLFKKQTGLDILYEVMPAVKRIVVAAAAAGLAAFLLLLVIDHVWQGGECGFRLKLARVAVPVAFGYAIYGLAAWGMRCPELDDILHETWGRLRRRLRR